MNPSVLSEKEVLILKKSIIGKFGNTVQEPNPKKTVKNQA